MIAGAAPLPGQIEEFMRVTSCSIVVQGYGKSFRRNLPCLTSVLWIKVHTNSSSAETSTKSVPYYSSFDFFIQSLATRLIQNLC